MKNEMVYRGRKFTEKEIGKIVNERRNKWGILRDYSNLKFVLIKEDWAIRYSYYPVL